MSSLLTLPSALAFELLDDVSEAVAVFDSVTGQREWQNNAWLKFGHSLRQVDSIIQAADCAATEQVAPIIASSTSAPTRQVVRWQVAGIDAIETEVSVRPFNSNGRSLVIAMIRHAQPVVDLPGLADKAHHRDPLTGVPGRAAVEARIAQLAQAKPASPDFALLFLDLDGFKCINDRWGHMAGDRVLVSVAKCLAGAVRGGDLIARYGGDEFVVLALGVRTSDELQPVVHRLRKAAETPIQYGDAQLRVSASIGAALSNEGWETLDDLIREADRRMYAEKNQSS